MTSSVSSIIDRFGGPEGRRLLVESLRHQRIVENSEEIATKLADVANIARHEPTVPFILQEGADNDVFFILAGTVSIQINGREVNTQSVGRQVGEMAAIDVHARRSASVVPITETVTAKVSEPDFIRIANEHPSMWRQLACELAERTRQTGVSVPRRNLTPKVFIGSSSKGLDVACAVQIGLQHDKVAVQLLAADVFQLSKAGIAGLETEIHTTDFGILVLTPDDKIESWSGTQMGPRDNAIFELGLLIGSLGRNRTFVAHPRGKDIKIPTDLMGAKRITYSPDPAEDLTVTMAPVNNELRKIISKLGPR
jgi:CRP/FNR family transcriptional regulator, cyclic AMP receptor protein